MRPRGKGNYQSTDNTKLGIKMGNSYKKNDEVSGLKVQLNKKSTRKRN